MEPSMISLRSIRFDTLDEVVTELEKLGFPPDQNHTTAIDTLCLHIKVEGGPAAMIPRLHDVALALKARLVRPYRAAENSETQDILLSGTLRQMEQMAHILRDEPSGLYEFSQALETLLTNVRRTRLTIPCRTQTLVVGEKTLIMGAINITPDSFSDGGLYLQPERAVDLALDMVAQGVDIIDIGGESTRPGSRGVDAEEELRRIIPVIQGITAQTDTLLSVDTRKARVAREALEAGCQIVNDVTALRFDSEMAHIAAHHGAVIVLMHMRGTPETMQRDIHYASLISEIITYLRESIDLAEKGGIDREKIIIDPGIGFGKTVDHNLAIIKHLYQFRILGQPILIGTSRKSFIGKILDLDVDKREEGTLASVVASILHGAHIVRVHDVRNAVRAARIADAVKTVSLPEV
jgi:dihydropteroate synthase